jgi:hypothetical protein
MGAFDQLKSWLTEGRGLKTSRIDVGAGTFVLLDPVKVATDLAVSKQASENGRSEIPSSDASTPDHFEETIGAHLKALESDQGSLYSLRLQALKKAVGNLAADLDFQALNAKVSFLFEQATAEVEKGIANIYLLQKQYLAAHVQHEDFKTRNNLHRIAPKNQGNLILKLGVILILLVVETVVNAGFFAQGTSGGLIGGGAIAFAVSVINLLGSFLIGYKLVPEKNKTEIVSKFVGWGSFIGWLTLAVALNLIAGHYREASAVSDPNQVGAVVTSMFRANPFGLMDIQSWYLLLIGLIFASIAFADGYNFDDPYPEFGRIWRHYKVAADRLAGAISDEHDYLQEHFDELSAEFQSRLDSIAARRANLGRFEGQANSLRAQFDAFQHQLASVYSAVIGRYRMENERVRSTAVPKFFGDKAHYELTFLLDHSVDHQLAQQVSDQIEQGALELPKLIKAIKQKHQELRARIPNFEELSNA